MHLLVWESSNSVTELLRWSSNKALINSQYGSVVPARGLLFLFASCMDSQSASLCDNGQAVAAHGDLAETTLGMF